MMRKLFRWLIILALPAGLGHCGYGLAATPQCYPGEATASKPMTVQNDYGAAAIWYCDVGHQWMQWHFRGSWVEVKAFIAASNFTGLMTLTHAQKDALWNSMPADTGQDASIKQVVDAQAWTADIPPSGVVTLTTNVYKAQAITGGGFKMVAVGTIALGKPCNTAVKFQDATGLYYGLTRTDVTMKKVGKWTPPLPNTAYGICT